MADTRELRSEHRHFWSPATGVAVGAALAIATWVVSMIVMADRGVDLSDESFYLLSYRWWNELPLTPTGVQYLIGPYFEATGYSIAALRVLRVTLTLAVHVLFAAAFISWFQSRVGNALSRSKVVATGLLIVAVAPIGSGWLPLSPGYNDVILWGAIALAALCIRIVGLAESQRQIPWFHQLALGAVLTTMVLAKWASGAAFAIVLPTLLIPALATMGFRGWTRLAVGVAGGAVVCAAAIHLFVMPLNEMLPSMLRANSRVAGSTNSPVALLLMYTRTSVAVGVVAALLAGAIGSMSLFAARYYARVPRLARLLAALAPPLLAALVFATYAKVGGGSLERATATMQTLLGLSLVVLGLWLHERRTRAVDPRWHGRRACTAFVISLCVVVPLVQALGTGNPLLYLAINAFALWYALVLAASTALRAPLARTVALSVVLTVPVVATAGAVYGVINDPYRTSGYSAATHVGTDRGSLRTVKLSRAEAERLRGVIDALGGVQTVGRPMMVFDEKPGIILALDGKPVGEAWFSAMDDARSVAGVREECSTALDVEPIVFFTRQPTPEDLAALKLCGADLARDYSSDVVPGWTPTLTVYMPKEDIR